VKDKVIGILGGMGPEATVDLFHKIILHTPAATDQEHLRIIVDNNPRIPDRTGAVLRGGPDPTPEMCATARNLERAGAELIVMPCNSAHIFLDAVRKCVRIPFLSIVDETVSAVKRHAPSIARVGLMASSGVVQTGLYARAFAAQGIEALVPNDDGQKLVMNVIYGVKAGRDKMEMAALARRAALDLISRGAEAVILGCTELPLVLHEGDVPALVVDATDILAEAAVRAASST
jgi:aspartate racemase